MENMVVELIRRRRLRLVPEVTAPRLARDFVASACAQWGADELADLARLLVSELVSNAVLHSGTLVEVEVLLDGGDLHLRVHDDGDGVPMVVQRTPRTIGGVGLDLVSRAAQAWGVTPDPRGGKDVWCILSAEQAQLSDHHAAS
ncbi:MAG: ATP-binding protein [Actinocrinis sp.]